MASTKTTRTRPYGVRDVTNTTKHQRFIGGVPQAPSNSTSSYKVGGSQYTESEGHPFLKSNKKGVEDLGGEFFTSKTSVEFGKPVHAYQETRVGTSLPVIIDIDEYTGVCAAYNPSLMSRSLAYASYSNDTELDALGTTAIAACSPTNPVGGLLSALIEIRNEGLPHLVPSQVNWKDRAHVARSAGSEYLNVQFGWSPLINDVKSFAHTVTHAHSVIEQYKRGIGKPIRREYRFPTVSESKETVVATGQRPHGPTATWFRNNGTLIETQSVVRERWFSGCFTYYFPADILGSKKLGDLAILADRMGLTPTPEVLWQVAPWSWAVDWFSNAGDVITNWSNFHTHGLVMRYGYMMEHSIVRKTRSLVGCTPIRSSAPPISDVSVVVETKVRRKANPYGFGITWEGLSPFQTSILAALGISRRR